LGLSGHHRVAGLIPHHGLVCTGAISSTSVHLVIEEVFDPLVVLGGHLISKLEIT
jgi:hypothetical protein